MKILLPAVACFALLTACGNDDRGNKGLDVTVDQSPQVSIAADALVSDYDCQDRREYTDAAGPGVELYNEKGIAYTWREGAANVAYEVEAGGEFHSLVKSTPTKLSEQQYSSVGESTTWQKISGQWQRKSYKFERIWERQGNLRRPISNKIDGEFRPYYWSTETVEVSEKVFKSIARHTNPAALDRDGRRYTKAENTCTYTDR